jgi:hypothetical protein
LASQTPPELLAAQRRDHAAGTQPSWLVRPDAAEFEHFGTLLNFIGDELAERGGPHRHWKAAQVCKRRLHLGMASAALISSLSLSTISIGVFFGEPTANPEAGLLTRDEIIQGGNVPQHF